MACAPQLRLMWINGCAREMSIVASDSFREPAMEDFDDATLAQFRELFLQRRQALVEETRKKLAQTRDERMAYDNANSTDGGDRATAGAATDIEVAEAARDGDE